MWVQNKCDLINMSYGEPTSVSNYGRFIQLANEVSGLILLPIPILWLP